MFEAGKQMGDVFTRSAELLKEYFKDVNSVFSVNSTVDVYYEKGVYVITGKLEDLQRIKISFNGIFEMSKISTGQSRHNCGLKYLRIPITDPAINCIITAREAMWGKGVGGPQVFVPTHEEILNLESVKKRNKSKPNNIKPITKERAFANGTRTIEISHRWRTEWTIYPFKGSIMSNGCTRKRGLSFNSIEDWEFALSWIINSIERIEAMDENQLKVNSTPSGPRN